jgi:hypothetical protein
MIEVPTFTEVVVNRSDRELDEVLALQGDRLGNIVIMKVKIPVTEGSVKGVNQDLDRILLQIQRFYVVF